MLLLRLKILGHSMEPKILNGQSVIASSVPFFLRKPKVGDIVVFEKDNELIVKRVVEFKDDLVLVSGDNLSDSRDYGWIKKESILGEVILKL